MSERFMDYHPDQYVRNYSDRGMIKWLGFYLSEHTAETEKVDIERAVIPLRKPQMPVTEISAILACAYHQRKLVECQLNTLSQGMNQSEYLLGTIEGMQENHIFLIRSSDQTIQLIPFESIKYIAIYESTKWSALS